MNLRRMIGALVVAVLASALVYAVLVVLGDGPAVVRAMADFRPGVLGTMLLLGLVTYFVRALRWRFLLRVVGHDVSVKDAVYLHLSGQTMSISPGRLGEVLKPWLTRELAGLPMTRGIALVFAERVADLIAVCVLSLGGLFVIGGGQLTLVAGLAVIVGGTWVASSAWFHRLALGAIAKQSWARKHHASASAISETVQRSLGWRTLSVSVLASALAWGLEGIGFTLCVHELGFDGFGLAAAVSVYAVSTIVGAFTFLPGGIGLTEASMAGILSAAGMAVSAASAVTLVTRVATLWWGVTIGWLALLSRPALLRRVLSPEREEPAPEEPASASTARDAAS